jgi:hypothetical protein
MRFVPILLLCAGLMLVQCKANLAQSRKTYDSLVEANVGRSFIQKYNNAKTYSLVHAKESDTTAVRPYAVIRLGKNEVVLSGKFNRGGYVRWLADDMIEVFSIPQHITKVVDSALYKHEVFLEGPR